MSTCLTLSKEVSRLFMEVRSCVSVEKPDGKDIVGFEVDMRWQ